MTLHLGENMKSIQTDINPTEICYQTHETYTIAHTTDFITFFFFGHLKIILRESELIWIYIEDAFPTDFFFFFKQIFLKDKTALFILKQTWVNF